jgi:uncharacterized protein (TIGR02679 family)
MLPVLAERLSRDPHELDQDQSAGRAFLILLQRLALRDSDETQAIDELHGEDRVRRRRSEASSALTADERAAIYAANNVAIDAISSTVAVWHLLGGGPVVAAARTMGMPIVLPLAALDMILTDDQVRAARNIVWVVENPAAFQALIATMSERSMDERPTLVCGSGFFSLAALRLLDRLVAAGARVLYSGDWDSNGLAIAHVAMHRWKGQFHLWRMDPSQDMNAPIDIERAPWHKDVAPRSLTPTAWMIARQRPRYQEAWIDALAMDLSQALSERLNDPAGPESRP